MSPILKGALAWAFARIAEPSTWAGLAGVVASMTFLPGAAADASAVQQLGTAAVAVASLIAIIRKEKGSPQ